MKDKGKIRAMLATVKYGDLRELWEEIGKMLESDHGSADKLIEPEPEFLGLNIYSPKGTTVYACFPENVYDFQNKRIIELGMTPEKPWTVERIDVGNYASSLYLKEFPGKAFNAVNFGVRNPKFNKE